MVEFTCDIPYLVIETTQLLATHSTAFYKTDEGPAIGVHWKKSGNYYGPLLISTVADYAKHTRNTSVVGSATINGVTWYLCGGNYWNGSTDTPSIPTLYEPQLEVNSTNAETIIGDILTAANASSGEMKVIMKTFAKVRGEWIPLNYCKLTDISV